MKVKDGVYIPDAGIAYPDDPFKRLVKVAKPHKKRFEAFDDSYVYLDNSFSYRLNHCIHYCIYWSAFMLFFFSKYGLKIKGRENLKKYKKELENGAVTVCNHVFQFDAVAVNIAVQPLRRMWIPMYSQHFNNGLFYWFIKYLGGIPVPDSMAGMRGFNEAFDEFHRRKDWIHIFPEEVRWDFYKGIRPFRKGAFSMSYKYDVPLVPCVITYRERKGLYRLTGKKNVPLMTIEVLDPVFPDKNASRKNEVQRMRLEAHSKMCEAAGIVENPWPAIPEDEA